MDIDNDLSTGLHSDSIVRTADKTKRTRGPCSRHLDTCMIRSAPRPLTPGRSDPVTNAPIGIRSPEASGITTSSPTKDTGLNEGWCGFRQIYEFSLCEGKYRCKYSTDWEHNQCGYTFLVRLINLDQMLWLRRFARLSP